MGIKNTDLCTFCKTEVDSVEHMLLICPFIIELWEKVNNWLEEIGFINYNLTETRKILGDIENGNTLTTIILLTKKIIYNAFKKGGVPVLQHIQNKTKNFFHQEKYDSYLKHKVHNKSLIKGRVCLIFIMVMQISMYIYTITVIVLSLLQNKTPCIYVF